MRWILVSLLTTLPAAFLHAQTVPERLAAGDRLDDALAPAEALEHYRAAFALEQSSRVAWRFARSQVNVAKQLEGKEHDAQRDSLYYVAQLYADFAVQQDSSLADAYFSLALALGQLSRTKGGRERVQFGRQIYAAAARAIELDPEHDGAHHIIGVWHAEVLRLSGIARFFARTLMGADFMAIASWDSATTHMEQAAELRPEYVFHHLELAEIYADLDRIDEAIAALETATSLSPTTDVMDHIYQRRAAELLARLREEGGP